MSSKFICDDAWIDRSVRKRKIKLSDGSYDKVFSNRSEELINCNICSTWFQRNSFESHFKGQRHQKNLLITPDVDEFKKKVKKVAEETNLCKSGIPEVGEFKKKVEEIEEETNRCKSG